MVKEVITLKTIKELENKDKLVITTPIVYRDEIKKERCPNRWSYEHFTLSVVFKSKHVDDKLASKSKDSLTLRSKEGAEIGIRGESEILDKLFEELRDWRGKKMSEILDQLRVDI